MRVGFRCGKGPEVLAFFARDTKARDTVGRGREARQDYDAIPTPHRTRMPFRALLLLASLLLGGCTVSAQEAPEPPALVREFRGVWVATVDNIDWPSRPGLPVATMRAELDAIVQRAVELKLNALVFQVRAAADAFYASRLEPWSEWLTGVQGQAPAEGFDPLAYLVARCHE